VSAADVLSSQMVGDTQKVLHQHVYVSLLNDTLSVHIFTK